MPGPLYRIRVLLALFLESRALGQARGNVRTPVNSYQGERMFS